MKFQPKRFVVEVKRGTNRASFVSPDASADRFSDAEAALFGATSGGAPKSTPPILSRPQAQGGRILQSLIEPPPPIVEVAPPSNRRGRKPGSKNKPKPQVPTPFPPSSAANQQDVAALMRSYGFADDGTVWSMPETRPVAEQGPPSPAPVPAPAVEPVALRSAHVLGRLRDRSSILKRYVLNIEPRPGQPGAIRARRMARASWPS